MDWAAIATGIGAILTAAGGVTLVVREFRRRDRRAYRQEVDDLSDQLHLCRADFTTFRTWAFELRQRAADAGVEDGYFHEELAEDYAALGRDAEAREHARRALELADDDDDSSRVRRLRELAGAAD